MKRSGKRIFRVFFALGVLCVGFFMSCSTSANSTSIMSTLSEVDALVRMGQTKQALKDLKKLEKSAGDNWSILGIYKRYISLDEKESARKLLQKSIKKNPKNPELLAVYTKYLLSENNLEEAGKYAENLKKTDYSSIYSEYVFRLRESEFHNKSVEQFLLDEEYLSLFYSAYNASKNPVWLRNSAAYYLRTGHYAQAAEITPEGFLNAKDAYFWTLVNYDSGSYVRALECIWDAFVFKNSQAQNAASLTEDDVIRLYALESDCCYLVYDYESAENIRENLLALYCINGEVSEDLKDNEILPLTFANAALWNINEGNAEKARDLLSAAVMNYPYYVPSLVLYSNFAWESNQERVEDSEVMALRKAGIKTLEMEAYDNRPKLPLSDALYRLELALEKTKNPYLYITRLDLQYKSNTKLSDTEKVTDLYKLIEHQSYETAVFNDVLVHYTLTFLLKTGRYEEAYSLFSKYLVKKYNFVTTKSMIDQAADNVLAIDNLDCEFAFWFSLYYRQKLQAARLGEYVCFESAGIRNEHELTAGVSTESVMNLANYYFSTTQDEYALDLYGKASGRESRKIIRSECFYRIAEIYKSEGQIKNALRACDYACSVNPSNAKAQLLKSRLAGLTE